MGALDRLLNPTAAPAAKPAAAPAPSGGALDRLLRDPARPLSTEGGLDLGPDPGLSFDQEPSFQQGAGGMPSRTTRRQRAALDEAAVQEEAAKAARKASIERAFGTGKTIGDDGWFGEKFRVLGYQAKAGLADVLDLPIEAIDGAATVAARLYNRRKLQAATMRGDLDEQYRIRRREQEIPEEISVKGPMKEKFREWGFLEKDIKTASEVVNTEIGELLQRGAEFAGGGDKWKAQDIGLAVETAFTALGLAGVRSTSQAARNRVNLAAGQYAAKILEAEAEARRMMGQEKFDAFQAAGGGAAELRARTPAEERSVQAREASERLARRRQVRAAFTEDGAPRSDPSWEPSTADMLAEVAAAADAARAAQGTLQPARLRLLDLQDKLARGYPFNAAEVRQVLDEAAASERTGLREGVLLSGEQGRPGFTSDPADPVFGEANARTAERFGLVAPRGQTLGEAASPALRLSEDLNGTRLRSEGAFQTRSSSRGAETMVPGTPTDLSLTPRPSLQTALEKVRRGQLFSLTSEERIALRGMAQDTTQRILDPKKAGTLAAVGATGLGLAMLYEPSAEEMSMAVGAGALLLGRGREPLTMRALRETPDATPLGAILERSPYTLSTLEMLPKNRFEFTVGEIKTLLERPGVTAAEKSVIRDALEESRTAFLAKTPESRASLPPGGFRQVSDRDTITAKQLMLGIKEATGDFELKRVESKEFSEYGLNAIGRRDSFDNSFDEVFDPAVFDTATARPSVDGRTWEVYDADGGYITNFIQDRTLPDAASAVARARAENQARIDGPASATTTIYQSPVELGTANHFGDRNYFAHTRSFVEGGVRHVVELQSDVAQKAGKALTGEERTRLESIQAFGSRAADAARRMISKVVMFDSTAPEIVRSVEDYLEFARKEGVEVDYKLSMGESIARVLNTYRERTFQEIPLFQRMRKHIRDEATSGDKDVLVDMALDALRRGATATPELVPDTRTRQLMFDEMEVSRKLLQAAADSEYQRHQVRVEEARSKLEDAQVDPVRPMLKDWHKRLIREEMARAAREASDARTTLDTYLDEKRREVASAEEDLRRQTTPQNWAVRDAKQYENAAYDLRVMAMDLKNGRVSEGTVRQYMLQQEQLLPPEARAQWREYYETNADETEGFLRPGRGEDGEWGASYAEAFPRAMASFLEASLGRVPWLKTLQEHIDYLKEQIATAEQQKVPSTIRFATADTVAKVERWPEIGRDYIDGAKTRLEIAREDMRRVERYVRDGIYEESSIAPARKRLAKAEADLAEAMSGKGPRFSPEHQGIYDRYAGDITKFLKSLGGKEITDDKGVSWIEVPLEPKKDGPPLTRTQMFGLGAAGALGAYAFSQNPEDTEMAAAALFGLGIMRNSRTRAIAENAGEILGGADYALGVLSTRIRSMDEALARRVRGFEMGLLTGNHERLAVASPFVERLSAAMKVADTPLKDRVRAAILDGRSEKVLPALGALGDPELVAEWRKNRDNLAATGRTLKNAGLIKELAPDYFPRMVVDYDGLVKYLGDEGSELDRLIQREQQRSMAKTGEELSPLEVSDLINRWMTRGVGGKPGFLRSRSGRIDELTADIARFYATPEESLLLYNRAATAAIERAKFFGKSAVVDPETGKINLSASIGAVVEEVRKRKKLTTQQERELRDMLQSRFGPGQRDMHRYLQDIRNVTNMGLLGHMTSALTQASDIAVVALIQGILPTIKSAIETAAGRPQRFQLRDLGIVDHVAEEFTSTRGSARALNKVFKWSGFNLVDKFAKETTLNAALRNYTAKSKTVEGQKAIRQKYGEYFGQEDLGKLISDLQAGRRTDLVNELLFGELSDLQPISRSEVPQGYLDAARYGKGAPRMLYQLKTFMVKQLDIYRNMVYREAKAGRPKQAAANFAKISIALGVGGATTEFIRNWILGRDDELEWKDIPLNLFKVFGWSEWVLSERRNADRLANYVGGMVLPPHMAWWEAVTLDPRAIGTIPLVGRILYNHDPLNMLEESGAEKFNRRKSEEERRELNRRLLGLTDEQMKVLDRIKKAERIQ